MHRFFALGLAVLLALLSGCSQYVDEYQYMPRPAVVEIPAQPPGGAPVRALASVVGVRREDRKEGIPASIEVGLRLENNSAQTVTFDPRSMELINGLVQAFPPPIVRPPQAVSLAAGQSTTVTAFFPFPAGHWWDNTDLSSLQVRWAVQMDGRSVTPGATFTLVVPAYYNPYWGYPPNGYPLYGGVAVIRRMQ